MAANERASAGWADVWQAPTLLASGALLLGGLTYGLASRPDPSMTPVLRDAARLVELERYEDAIGLLNARIFPYLERPQLRREDRRDFHLLMARSIYAGQQELEVPQEINDRNVVVQYTDAERFGAELTSRDLFALADTYSALSRHEEAVELARGIPEIDRELRDRLHERVIGRLLRRENPGYREALEVITSMLADAGLPRARRVWALAKQAEVQTGLGYADEAVTNLLREMPTLVAAKAEGVGRLYLELGRAYLDLDVLEEAERALRTADRDELLPPASEERALARLLRGHAEARLATDETLLESARDLYASILENFTGADVFYLAELGVAEMEAALGNPEGALEAYASLAGDLLSDAPPLRPAKREVVDSLLQRFERQLTEWRTNGDRASVDLALRFSSLAASLYGLTEMPPDVLEAAGVANRSMAADVIGRDPSSEEGAEVELSLFELRELDPASLQRAKRHLIRAAAFYREHASRFITLDNRAYADSLWTSARLFEQAGDGAEAIRAFNEFADGLPGDPRRPEAVFRLGQAYQSRGEYTLAAERYRELIEARQAEGLVRVGDWADRSLTPLAQCYLLDADPENDGLAESLLLGAVSGDRGGPGRPEFREALVALGRMHARQGRHAEAVERLDEVLGRYPEDPEAALHRFRLADSLRLLAGEMRERLTQSIRDTERRELERTREAHLRRATTLYLEAREQLSKIDPRQRTRLESLYLRNAHFYVGDCAFDLGEYEEAISHYNTARSRYPTDPAVLVGLIQIVNAYVALGDLNRARAANERAREYYEALPPEVWQDGNLPLGREDWQRWLDSSTALYQATGSN